jgi:hypothetical protein
MDIDEEIPFRPNPAIYPSRYVKFQYADNSKTGRMFRTLIDSGATDGNYISHRHLKFLRAQGLTIQQDTTLLGSAIGDNTQISQGMVTFTLRGTNDNNEDIQFAITAKIVKLDTYDIILGLPTIRDHDLFAHIKRQIYGSSPKGTPKTMTAAIYELVCAIAETPSYLIPMHLEVPSDHLLSILEDEDDLDDSFAYAMDPELYNGRVARAQISGNDNFNCRV